ncbi:MAG: RNA-binding protein [Desulfuromonas sp.]|nr:MAG: RNA-binding protein [Desulfuromonas sp.]
MKSKFTGKEVVVSNIPANIEEEELRKLFSVCGSVRSIKMLCDSNEHFYGKAFIRMGSNAEAKDAINSLDGARLINRCIRVSAPRKEPPQEPARQEETRPKKNHTPRRRRR